MRNVIPGLLILALLSLGCGADDQAGQKADSPAAAKSESSPDMDSLQGAIETETWEQVGEPSVVGAVAASLELQGQLGAEAGVLVGGRGFGGGGFGATIPPNLERFQPDLDIPFRQSGFGITPGQPKSSVPTTGTWKRSQILPNTSRLKVGDDDELPLKGLQADVRIDGFRARVLLDCFYYNDKDRQLEGSFQIRLPSGASLDFFAFGQTGYELENQRVPQLAFFNVEDLQTSTTAPEQILAVREERWTDPQVARIVPRERASYSYRDTVRRSVDPALVEWSGAGVFSASVFPLAPQKLHRIVIGYDVPLVSAGDALFYRLELPEVPTSVTDLSLASIPGSSVTVTPDAEAVTADSGKRYRFDDPTVREITVRIDNPGTLMLAGKDVGGEEYFATRVRPDVPAVENSSGSQRAVFLVDTSLSSNPDRFNIWLKLLRSILEQNRDSMREFAVLFFNVEAFWWQEGYVANDAENVDALLKFADTLSLEGATNLGGALVAVEEADWQEAGDLFLLSDGAATWGESDLYALSGRLKSAGTGSLFAYTTGLSGTDDRVLSHLARESGGGLVTVVGDDQISEAAVAHRRQAWQVDSVEVAGGGDLLIAGRPTTLFPGQELLLAGRGRPAGDHPEIIFSLSRSGETQKLRVKIDRVLDSELASRAYGRIAVAQLESFTNATEEFSAAYARHFRVPGQTCSLLMLESEEDYERYNIKPQEDSLVVKQNGAAGIVAATLKSLGNQTGDPRSAFLAWLEKLEKLPNVELRVSTALRLALEGLPAENFVVTSPPLVCRQRTREGVPPEFQKVLSEQELDYDAIVREAARRREEWGPADGIRVLSSLVERNPGDSALERDLGFTAMQWGLGGEAYGLIRRVATNRPDEPQTYHAIARCLASIDKIDLAIAYYEIALAGKWDSRFGAFDEVVGLEYVSLLRRIAAGELETSLTEFADARLKTLGEKYRANEPVDLLVSIMWNTDATDIDLHVIDPNGEECYYENAETKIGGKLTDDVTQGYGPEMFRLPKAIHGKYVIRAKFYSGNRNRTSARTKVYATIYENWGTEGERVAQKVVVLADDQEMHDLATVMIER